MVALYHFPVLFHTSSLNLIRNSWLFVDFFFVLSGFVISYAFEEQITTAQAAVRFEIRRFGRLWPLHVTILLVGVILETSKLIATHSGGAVSQHPAFTGRFSIPSIFTNLFLLQPLGGAPTWNEASWTIAVEFWTYLLFCLACLVAPTTDRVFRAWILRAIYAGAAVVGFLVAAHFSPATMDIDSGLGFFRCFFGFFSGALTFHVWRNTSSRKYAYSLLEILVVVAVCLFVSLADEHVSSYWAPLVFAFSVWTFAHEGGVVSRVMRLGPIQSIGRLSYGIYMLHFFLMQQVVRAVVLIGQHWKVSLIATIGAMPDGEKIQRIVLPNVYWSDLMTLSYLAATIGLAALSYRFIEHPARRYFNRLATNYGGHQLPLRLEESP